MKLGEGRNGGCLANFEKAQERGTPPSLPGVFVLHYIGRARPLLALRRAWVLTH